jgi:transmembrane protein
MPAAIARILDCSHVALVARIVLTFPFWASGLSKLIDFSGGAAEMAHFGLQPAALFNVAVLVTQLAGSALIIANRHVWLGAGALAVFTLLTIPIAHDFWNQTGPAAVTHLHSASEHPRVIAGLILVAILSRRAPRQGT